MDNSGAHSKSKRSRRPKSGVSNNTTSSTSSILAATSPQSMTASSLSNIPLTTMDRDAEYRNLNAQLREKNYRLQQLQQQLAANAATPQTTDREKSAYKKEKRTKSKRTNKEPPPVSASVVPAPQASRDPFSSSRGMLRVAVPTKTPTSVPAPAPVRAIEPLVAKHRQLEAKVQSFLEQLRRDKGRLQDYCLLGLSNGAPELANAVSDLQRHYIDTITTSVGKACELEYPQLLWELRHKLLQFFYSVLSSNANSSNANDASLFAQVKSVFISEVRSCVDTMQSVLTRLLNANQGDETKFSVHGIYLALGNLARYQFIYPVDGVTGMREAALAYYYQAIDVYPGEGAAHRCLAAIAKSDHDAYSTCYHLCRALSSTNPLSAAREPLLEVLEGQREIADTFPAFTALSGLSLQQHCDRFRCHYLAAAGIAYARTGADRFPQQLDKCRRHFAMMLQLLSAECGDGSDRGSKGSAVLYTPDMQHRDNAVNESLHPLVRQMENDFRFSIVMTLSLLQQVVEKHDLKQFLDTTRYQDAYGSSDANTYTIEERVMLEKRYVTQRMHKIQTIPGLVDLARLLMSLICAALTAEGVGVGTSGSASAASRFRIQCTVSCVCMFFEWLSANSLYHLIPILDVSLWEQLEASLPVYLSQLPKCSKQLTQACDVNLPQDLDLRGFVPLKSLIHCRTNVDTDVSEFEAVVLFSERCRRSIRSLCRTPLVIGNSEHGISFDCHRQPSPVNMNSATLQVLTYRVAAPSSGTLYAQNQKVLSYEEFMQGALVEADEGSMPEEQEQDESNDDDIDEAAAALAAQCAAMLLPPSIEQPTSLPNKSIEPTPPLPPQTEERRGMLRIAPTQNHKVAVPQQQHRAPQPVRAPRKAASSAKAADHPPLIVIDAANVAMRHGLNNKFSCKGIKIAIDFFCAAGHKVVAFLPDYYLDYGRVGDLRNMTRLGITDERASKLPDNVTILQQLVSEGLLIGTPPQDYDDSYCITYAKQRGGYVISNDMYRDHVKRVENKAQREELRLWLKSHCISYTFVGDEFLPNPDATLV